MLESPIQSAPPEVPAARKVPWSLQDAYLGFGLIVALLMVSGLVGVLFRRGGWVMPWLQHYSVVVQSLAPTAVEIAYVLPVLLILTWRGASWLSLGFRRFDTAILGLGCVMTSATYMVLIAYGVLLVSLKIKTQGETLLDVMRASQSPGGLIFAAVVAAPFAEEIFFRGFLFQALLERFNWIAAALISSAVFAAMHLQLAALLPTFLLGCVLAYVFYKSNSIWPGMILHCVVNSFAISVLLRTLAG